MARSSSLPGSCRNYDVSFVWHLASYGPVVSITGIEWWHFAIVAFPEVVALVLRVLRRGPVVFVRVVGVHIDLYSAT